MKKINVSAGLLAYREGEKGIEVFLAHPGGPLWKKKDNGWWSIPKGGFNPEDETPMQGALREFAEETGFQLTSDDILAALVPSKQKSGKIVHAFLVKHDFDVAEAHSNTFTMEWPPRSGKQGEFPEIDSWQWFGIDEAREKILEGQVSFIDELVEYLNK